MQDLIAPQKQASCPVCGAKESKCFYEVTASDAAQHFVRKGADVDRFNRLRLEIQRLWAGETCQVRQCSSCSFVYAFPYVAGGEAFYSVFLLEPSYPKNRFEFGRTHRALQDMPKSADARGIPALLEVGAGDGAFIRQVVPDFFSPENVLCTEFSDAGARSIRSLGVECKVADVRALSGDHELHRFSAICMFQVLEHLDDLDELWEAFNRLAAPNADLFLSVPNDKWIAFQEAHCGSLDMPPNHVGRWNHRAFETMGERHHWKLIAHDTEPCGRLQLIQAAAGARFFHARHTSGSLTDRTTRIHNRSVRRIFSIPTFAWCWVGAAAQSLGYRPNELGQTQWAHLRKA